MNYKELIADLRKYFYDEEIVLTAADAIELLATDIDVARKQRDELVGIADRFKTERDALLNDFLKGFQAQVKKEHGIFRCDICKHGFENNPQENGRQKEHCDGYTNWEWRGASND